MRIKQKVKIQYIKLIKTAVRNNQMPDSWILKTMPGLKLDFNVQDCCWLFFYKKTDYN